MYRNEALCSGPMAWQQTDGFQEEAIDVGALIFGLCFRWQFNSQFHSQFNISFQISDFFLIRLSEVRLLESIFTKSNQKKSEIWKEISNNETQKQYTN